MKKKKILVLGVLGAASVVALAAIAPFGNNLTSKFGFAETPSYSLKFDTNHKIVDTQVKTDNGNTIWAKDGGVVWGETTMTLGKGNYIQNLTKLTGIKAVNITMTSGKVEVHHGFVEPSDLVTPMFYDNTLTATGTVTFDCDPGYVRVIALDESVISCIEIEYDCSSASEAITFDDYDYSLEKTYFGYSQNGVASIVEGGFNSDYCVKFENINFRNESNLFRIDLSKAIEKELVNFSDTVSSLSVDVKDNNNVMANNSRYGFQASIDSTVSTESASWINTVDWGCTELGEGWWRCYYSFNPIPKENLSSISFWLLRKNADGQEASQYMFDNIRLFESNFNIKGIKGNNETAHDFSYPYEENKLPTEISFEYQLLNDATNANFMIGNGWGDYAGYFNVQDGVCTDSTIRAEKLKNHWYKVSFFPGLKATYSGTKNYKFALIFNNASKWTIGNYMVKYDAPVAIAPGQKLYLDSPIAVADYSGLTLEYKLSDAATAEDVVHLCMKDGSTNNYAGSFQLTASGCSNQGVTSEVLSDGYVRLTFDFDNLNRANALYNSLADAGVTSIDDFYTHSSWGAPQTITLRNISYIPRVSA